MKVGTFFFFKAKDFTDTLQCFCSIYADEHCRTICVFSLQGQMRQSLSKRKIICDT